MRQAKGYERQFSVSTAQAGSFLVRWMATILLAGFVIAAILAPVIAPMNPHDPSLLRLENGFLPPLTKANSGEGAFLLGSDDQGRDILSAILYGMRLSLLVGFLSVMLAIVTGVPLGLLAAWRGGLADAVIMRLADIQSSFPAILLAMLIYGILNGMIAAQNRDNMAFLVLVLAIGLSEWVMFARLVRAAARVEMELDYVAAAQISGRGGLSIALGHILPNIAHSVIVLAGISFGLAVLAESSLSFLGIGVSPMHPSLGTLIGNGQKYIYSGEWWILLFPALTLTLLVLCVNVLGERFSDALSPARA